MELLEIYLSQQHLVETIGLNPIFPTYGSNISLSAKFHLPYSLWNGIDYSKLEEKKNTNLKILEVLI